MTFRNRQPIYVLLALVLALLLVITGCTSSSSPSDETSNGATSDNGTTTDTSSDNGTPTESEPSGEPLAGLNLVDEPLATKRLDVAKIYSGGDGPGLCYLGSYAMLAKFADSAIDFTDVIANCGIATSALYIPEINLLLDGFEVGSIAVAAGNQGFDYYIAALEGAQLTDEFLAANLVEDAQQIISMEDEDGIFELLKRLISSDTPVMVHLDVTLLKEALVSYCPYWETIFEWQETYMASTHIDHYMTVTGYDESFVYLNDPTDGTADGGKDIPVAIADFLNSWKNGNHPSFAEESLIGPYWMLFLGERGAATSTSELLSWNRDIATEAVSEIRQATNDPTVSELIHCNGMYRAREEFGAFLQENGYTEAGDIFLEISQLFAGLCQSSDPGADLLEIADLLEQALGEW